MPADTKPMQLLEKIKLVTALARVMTGGEFKVVHALMLYFYNSQDGRCFPSYRQLAEVSGTSPATAVTAIKKLKELGLVNFDPSSGGWNKRNSYRINVQVAERLIAETFSQPNKVFSQPNTNVQPAEHKRSASRNAYINEGINEKNKEEREGTANADAQLAPAGKDYAFKGKFVKGVSEPDLEEWLKANDTFTRSSLLAELKRIDKYYSGKGATGKPPKNWFFTTEAWIERTHKRASEDRVKARGRVLPSGRVMSEEEYNAVRGAI